MAKNNKLISETVLLLLVLLITIPFSLAKDISMSVNQSNYYFLVGEDAIIPLEIENTYGKQINGLLSYTMTQEINQGSFHYSSSNTQSKSFSVEEGKSAVSLNFGTSDMPLTLKVDLSFSYTEKEQRMVNLGDILIHFVSDNAQKQNKLDKIQSSSKKYAQPAAQQQSLQQSFMQQMQEEIDKMFGQQPINQQKPEQRLQNNQMAQDSSALKQQMQKQLQQQKQMKEEFQRQLAKNNNFQQAHQQLVNQGYNLNNAVFNPSSNNTGSFELTYQKKNGETASLKGEMQNGKMAKLEKFTAEDRKEILEKLQQNTKFKQFAQKLEKQGFKQTNTNFKQLENKTLVSLDYRNNKNQTATIKAEFTNGDITKVELEEKNKTNNHNYLWFAIIIVLLSVAAYFIYKGYLKKPVTEEYKVKAIEEKPFDYVAEARKMLKQSELLFKRKKYKDAYAKAGQALRLFLSYENGLKKELTNKEIIEHLKNKNKDYKKIKECFDLCSLVEFAKYQANKKDFEKIIKRVKDIIECKT
jgi:HEPN domain-containing protein